MDHFKNSLLIGCLTFVLALLAGTISSLLLSRVHFLSAIMLLLITVSIGVVFDTIGVAATAAREEPFHARSAKKIRGAREAVHLIRNADQVATLCCDIIGDIMGIISGAIGMLVVYMVFFEWWQPQQNMLNTLVVALTAALTVAGKAYGKHVGIEKSHEVIFFVSRGIALLGGVDVLRRGKNGGQGNNRKA